MKLAIGLLGYKLGMTQIFMPTGEVIPVTVVQAGPCVVVQRRIKDRDGYNAIQVGFGAIDEKKVNKPLKGHFSAHGVRPVKFLKEFRVDDVDKYESGQEISVDIFSEGEKVKVTGISKGKGFAGAMKRYGFHGGPASHGSGFHRKPASIGMHSYPGRVFKGKRMPGHMGVDKVTVKNVTVVKVDKDNNLILLKGSVPGNNKSLVVISK